jgi:homoserine O-acetyltransferase
LTFHGEKLKARFLLSAYKLMNHLLKTNDITRNRGSFSEVAKTIEGSIYIVSVDTDWFYLADENKKTYQELKASKENVYYHEIKSIHGHDAFLIEYQQIEKILNPIFKKQQYYVSN